MNNQHEIAMVRHWICKAIYSQAKNAKYYRTYAEHADVWANKALAKGRNTERKDAMRMTRKPSALNTQLQPLVTLVQACSFLLGLHTRGRNVVIVKPTKSN